MTDHGHDHSKHDHHQVPDAIGKAFVIGITLNAAYVLAEAVSGIILGSTALLADAAHNAGDVLGLAMSLLAIRLARRARSSRHTYGLRRGTILAALANAMILFFSVGAVTWESILRLGNPPPVAGGAVAIVAAVGVVVNAGSAALFAKDSKGDINVRSAFLHLAGDAAIASGVVIAGIVIWRTGWAWLDPAVSLVVSALVLLSGWRLFREAFGLAMDAVPKHIDLAEVEACLRAVPGIVDLHDLHVWPMSTTEAALTVHLVTPLPVAPTLLRDIEATLDERFKIGHVTIQVEPSDAKDPCRRLEGV